MVEALVAVSARAGKPVWIPPDAPGHCCGTPWASKGHPQGQRWMAAHTAEALWRWSDGGRLPIVIDASSCTGGVRDAAGVERPAAGDEHEPALAGAREHVGRERLPCAMRSDVTR